ncbi:hypothetical protein SAMN05660337_3478 [Maridesulfovibrio ferrireducens]|uniref:Uncharacterized protein n=1 Tax=Maridesulfovibrio ferrireducens TaxID=246191 RepID=A0A1G9LQM2_9BACT|nr:hypothetical protein [Maridesulfovibrio ferrireducens]SDL64299.1 hypothetical protein SAMN05660337_3478 [Maridesulfovibrio ferrireducens]
MDQSYAESIASDIMQMLETTKASGLDMNSGFQNDAFKSDHFLFGYIFYPRETLLNVSNLPQSVRKKVKKSNILGTVSVDGKTVGIHLVCSLPMGFDEITSKEDIIAGVNEKELIEFKEQIAKILHKDLVGNIEKKEGMEQ